MTATSPDPEGSDDMTDLLTALRRSIEAAGGASGTVPDPVPDPVAVRDAVRVVRGDLGRSMGRGPVQRAMGVLADWAAATLPREES